MEINAHMRMYAYAWFMARDVDDLLTALSDPTRLRALQIVWDGREHCVCELMDRLGVTQSRMSRHMARLKSAGLLTDRRDAQWVRYRRNAALPEPYLRIIESVLAAMPSLPHATLEQKAA